MIYPCVARFLNSSAPFSLNEYDTVWKLPPYAPWGFDEYPDFKISNNFNSSCTLPQFWLDTGEPIDVTHDGCYASEFDQFGDVEAFGVFPDCEDASIFLHILLTLNRSYW